MYFAVIDTETTWSDRVMSLGAVIADSTTFEPVDRYYYVMSPEYAEGGIFSDRLFIVEEEHVKKYEASRKEILDHFYKVLVTYGVTDIFAYNARFDYSHLPEFKKFNWIDIMRAASYRQYNKYITASMATGPAGKLAKGYGVQPIYRMVTGKEKYKEKHNGYYDAFDELTIMRKLEIPYQDFFVGQITRREVT